MTMKLATTPSPVPALTANDRADLEVLDDAALAEVTGGGPILDLPEDYDAQQRLFDWVNRR